MKKFLPAIMAITSSVFIAVFVIWAFSLHGTKGVFHVNGQFHAIFILLFVSIAILSASGVLYIWLAPLLNPLQGKLFSIALVICALPGLIAPLFAYAYTNGSFSGSIGDTPPQLIITADNGAFGIPNIALTFNSSRPTANTVIWGTQDNPTSIIEEKASRRHVFILRDLQPSTGYTYRINNNASYSFTTPSADGMLHFAVCSDTHFGAGNNRSDLTTAMLQAIAMPTALTYFFLLATWSSMASMPANGMRPLTLFQLPHPAYRRYSP
ncbi:MAG: fibronectin type III domain-containing protein [Dehalococcoidia bacterium]|nr:fibronectin type III domain-containing protein [Dehalococcoidia bacterium]